MLTIRTYTEYNASVNSKIEHSNMNFPGTDTAINLYGPGILDRLHTIIEPFFGPGPFIIVTDGTIWKVAASRFAAFLEGRPETTLHILPAFPPPYACDQLVARIAAVLAATGAVPVAVGSGTINDIVKRAAFECGMRYVCVPTAPSVDGFSSSGAAITVAGFKTTLECPPPLCVVADEDIIVHAPGAMIASGYGDIIAKLTGGADWLIADLMGIEAIDPVAWDLAQSAAVSLLPWGAEIQKGDSRSIGILYKGLISTGLAIQRYHDSRPASGTEHFMSHTWEMFHLKKDGQDISHGFKVAVGTLIAAALMRELFAEEGAIGRHIRREGFMPSRDLLGYRMRLAELIPAGNPMKPKAIKTIQAKTPPSAEIVRRAQTASLLWQEISGRVRRQIPDFAVLKRALRDASCPVEPGQIGLSRKACADSMRIASLIRARYSVLDLISELGVLDMAVDAVFSPRYFSEYVPD